MGQSSQARLPALVEAPQPHRGNEERGESARQHGRRPDRQLDRETGSWKGRAGDDFSHQPAEEQSPGECDPVHPLFPSAAWLARHAGSPFRCRGKVHPAARRLGAGCLQDPAVAFVLVAASACRFVVSNIKASELRDEYAFNVFEPDVALEVHGKNAFESFGRKSLPIVIMASREVWLRETANLIRGLDRGTLQWEYHYPLYGTVNDIYVAPSNGDLKVFVDWQRKGHKQVGDASMRD